ncbi:MAG: cell wall-binding repeat-containing protein [Actinomycetota bacterium]|nr:MAG: cell wall binding repeat 2-containing [Actinomycetota bacterium]MDO8949848.1 cell wall-binding repeat-containing protein [Actinomycetota bacterium]MDP3629430.1 cell wall-binding repeat-containing protein [Actinomycetota bacterium]
MFGARTHLRTVAMAATAFVVAVICVLASATPALAASIPVSIERMSAEARTVVEGVCISTTARALDPVAGPRAGIVTDIVVRVSETIAGAPASTITITQPGGEVGGIGLMVSETPVFIQGGRYVVFFGANRQVVAGAQGALAISGTRVGSAGESLMSLKRRVKAAKGTPMTLAETIAGTVAMRAADAAVAVITPLEALTISGMSPSDVSAGTGDTVTISGTGFGSTQGTVTFFRRSGLPDLTAIVTAWSDVSITCTVPKGASSGGVTVKNADASSSASCSYDVGFSYGGVKWLGGTPSAKYLVNANCADTTSEKALVDAAAATWNAASDFKFIDGVVASTSTVNPPGQNNKNDIFWASSGFTGALAANWIWYYEPPVNQIIESDIVFNDAFNWGDGTGGTYDIQAVALHELGHSLNLSDQYGSLDGSESKVMYGFVAAEETRRALSADDLAGIRWIYGFSGDVTPPVMGTISSISHTVESTWYSNHDVSFSWSATDSSPITYSYVLDQTAGTIPDATPEGSATTLTCSGKADGVWYLHVRAVDSSGNWSTATAHRAVRIDTTAPQGTFAIAGGASWTATTAVTVDSSITGATEMRIAADGLTFGPWRAYAATVNIMLPDAEGTKTVAVQYRDAALNMTPLTDTITLNYAAVRAFSSMALEGTDRYTTALAVSRSTFATGSCDTVIIATGGNFPDALGAGGLAGAARCPILLVKSTGSLPALVRTEINRLTQGRSPRTVYIAGGTGVVSSQTETDLKALVGSARVVRLGGIDRYATANLIARRVGIVLAAKGIPYSGTAFVATGATFSDALLASPVAYAGQRPVLLIGTKGVDTALRSTIAALGVTHIDIVGSTASVSTAVQTALDGIAGVSVDRVASSVDRYAMAVSFAEYASSTEGFTFDNAGIATGNDFPDALAAGPALGESRSVMLLTPTTYLDSRVRAALVAHYVPTEHIRYFGGTGALSQAVRDTVSATLQ